MQKNSLLKNAKKLRAEMTTAENRLWYFLRNRRFCDLKFRRQVPMGNYIVDFICFKEKLIIELDGGQHASQEHYDGVRTKYLNSRGFHIVRFWNHEVLYETQAMFNQLLRILNRENAKHCDLYSHN